MIFFRVQKHTGVDALLEHCFCDTHYYTAIRCGKYIKVWFICGEIGDHLAECVYNSTGNYFEVSSLDFVESVENKKLIGRLIEKWMIYDSKKR